jgi:hypothetical protein
VIEVAMVRRMATRALLLAPFLIAGAALFGGLEYALSAAIGLALTIVNLWIAARIIGGVAENSPGLLMAAALGAFAFGLLLLTGIALALQKAEVVFFPVTGFVLVGSHLLLVLWEAAGAHDHIDAPLKRQSSDATAEPRS